MPESRRSLSDILRGLAERLTDEALAACFRDLDVPALRASLTEAARLLAAPSEGSGPAGHRPAGRSEGSGQPVVPLEQISLFTDGAARGNPGEAGAGLVLLDGTGREVAARGLYLGQCTNNVAEYRALILGLREARAWGAQEIVVHLDSELVVRQLLGLYQVKDSKLKPLFAEAKALLEGFKLHRVLHVPREENQRADQLANEGIDQALAGRGLG